MLGRIATVGSKVAKVGSRAAKVGACAALITAGAAGVQFYEGGRERVAAVFGPAVETTRATAGTVSARAESLWERVEADPEKYIGLLAALAVAVVTVWAGRRRAKSNVEALVTALAPAEKVSPAVQMLQNKKLASQLRAELRAMDARASHFRTDIERAEKVLAEKTKDALDAQALLDAAKKEEEDAAECLREYLTERDAFALKRAEFVAELERLDAAC